MFGQTRNQLSLKLRLKPAGPILMKADDDSVRIDIDTEARSPAEQMVHFANAKAIGKMKGAKKWKKANRDRHTREREALQNARRAGDDYSMGESTGAPTCAFVMTYRREIGSLTCPARR
ncbi:MAG: hypothetical protein R2873_35210 [Caldilineaceae bacterium]